MYNEIRSFRCVWLLFGSFISICWTPLPNLDLRWINLKAETNPNFRPRFTSFLFGGELAAILPELWNERVEFLICMDEFMYLRFYVDIMARANIKVRP